MKIKELFENLHTEVCKIEFSGTIMPLGEKGHGFNSNNEAFKKVDQLVNNQYPGIGFRVGAVNDEDPEYIDMDAAFIISIHSVNKIKSIVEHFQKITNKIFNTEFTTENTQVILYDIPNTLIKYHYDYGEILLDCTHIKSLKGIEKVIECKRLYIMNLPNDLGILPLLKLKNKVLNFNFEDDQLLKIFYKHLKTIDIVGFGEELIEAGFKGNAKM